MTKSVIVGYDDKTNVMIVGQRVGHDTKIVNAFRDENANELWKKLTVKKSAGEKK